MTTASRRYRRAAAILALLAAGLFLHGSAPALTLTRYPWVSLQTTTSMHVAWQTDAASTGKVLYGPTPDLGSEATHAGLTVDHAVPLAGLSPATRYFYRVVSGSDTLTDGSDSFRTAPGATEMFRFVAFGDLGRATPEQIAVASRIDSVGADLGILTGDIIYEAGEAANFTPQYFDIYRPTIARIPFYPSLGNHDVGTAGGQPYLDAFYLPSNNPASTERYYSFDYSNAHFAALEVTVENTAPSAAMLAWLDADLAATSQHWKFVFFHVPMYSNPGVHGGDATITSALEPIMNARGVDIVFQGHNHYYTRTYPISAGSVVNQAQEPAYLNPGGTIYIVTGGGGRFLHALAAALPIEAYSNSTFHTTVVDVAGSGLVLQAVDRDGVVIDMMGLVKGAPTSVEPERRGEQHSFTVGRPRPNPSLGPTDIPISLGRPARVRVIIVDVAGRKIREIQAGALGPGPHTVRWDGLDRSGAVTPSGIYYAVVQAGAQTERARLVRLK